MTDVPKNGYSYTGYTEPFIAPEPIALNAPLAKVNGYLNNDDPQVQIGITGAVPIENTEFRNAGLFIRVFEVVDGTTITTKDINFDGQLRMDTGHGIFIIRDDNLGYQQVTDMFYNSETGLYTVTVTSTSNMVAGGSYKVAARIPDLGTGNTASRAYDAGELVVEPYI